MLYVYLSNQHCLFVTNEFKSKYFKSYKFILMKFVLIILNMFIS